MVNPISVAFSALAEGLKRTQSVVTDEDSEKHWRAANLSYKFWPVQKKMAAVLTAPGSLKKVLNCSRRLRKTTTALVKATELGLKKRNALMRFAAPTRDMLVTIIEPIMSMICEDAPEDLKPVWLPSRHHYYFPSTGARLFVAGCDNLKAIGRLRGRAADLCVVDEAQEIVNLRYLVDDVLMPQLLGVDGARGPLWMLFTPPKTPIHECVKYAQEAQQTDSYAEYNIYESNYPPEVIEKFRAEAGGENSTTWLREYMCQFVVDSNFSLVPEWRDSMVGQYVSDEFYKFYFRYEGMDISGGKKHKTANLYGVYDFKKAKLFIQDETIIEAKDTNTKNLAEAITEKEKELWGEKKPYLRIADNNNLILLQDLGLEHGINFAPTNKDTLDAMVNNVRLWVGGNKVVVDPKCKQLIGSLKYGVWDDNRKHWEESVVYGHFDALAALMYLLRYVDVSTNPIPKTYGLMPDFQFIKPSNDLDKNAQTLKDALLPRRR